MVKSDDYFRRKYYKINKINRFGPKIEVEYHLNFSFNLLLNTTGITEMVANMMSIRMDVHERILALEVSFWRVVPAWIAMKEGGATPKKVPIKNGLRGTSTIGEVMFINQLGSIGVIRRKIM